MQMFCISSVSEVLLGFLLQTNLCFISLAFSLIVHRKVKMDNGL